MEERVGWFERGVVWLVHHISGSVALAIVLLLYPGLGLVLPVALGVRGHEKVPGFGHEKSPLMATKSPRFWPREVPTPH
jgi:hypothetical protein